MFAYWNRWLIANIASPYVLALVSYLLFLCALLFPSGLYTSIMDEQDFVFCDPLTCLLFTLCIIAFMLGCFSYHYLKPISAQQKPTRYMSVSSPLSFLLVPIGISTTATLIYLVFLSSKLDFIGLILSFQGDVLKKADNTFGIWDYIVGVHISILLWAYCRSAMLITKPRDRRSFAIFFRIGFIVAILFTLARVDRTDLMTLVLGSFVVRIHTQSAAGKLSLGKLIFSGFRIGIAAVAFFSLFAYLRGFRSIDGVAANLLGYSLVSYNHLAALVHGILTYPYGGKGIYLFPVLSFNPTLNAITHLNDYLGGPTRYIVFQSEFAGTAASELNPSYIWTGMIGYVFSDLGWLSPFYMGIVGIFYGAMWRSFRLEQSMGLIVYPWLAACQLLWLAYAWAFETKIVIVIILGAAFKLYESRFIALREPYDKTFTEVSR